VKLTRSGAAFLPYAERMLQLMQESKLTLSEPYREHISVSGPGTVWHYRYLDRILDFRIRNPHVAVKFLSYIDPSYMIRDLLLDGIVDVAIRMDPFDYHGMRKKLLFEDGIVLVSAKEPRATGRAALDFSEPDYCHIDWGKPFADWFESLVGPGYIPALQTDHSSIMLTMLLEGSVFGFLPYSLAAPHLSAGRLHEVPLPAESPAIKGYACYMIEKRQQPTIRLALEMLGVEDEDG
jgi:DNA-binding transcriptional LysR family regulator